MAVHKAAAMKGMDELFDDIMIKGDGEMARLRSQQQFQEPLSQLAEQVKGAPLLLPCGPLPSHQPLISPNAGQLGDRRAHRDARYL